MKASRGMRGQVSVKALVIGIMVIVIVIAIHHFWIVNKCCPGPTGASGQVTTKAGGWRPPYVAELRLLNGTDKRAKLITVKVNKDATKQNDTNPANTWWDPIDNALQPAPPAWLNSGLSYFTWNQGAPAPAYGVYVEVQIEGDPTVHKRITPGLNGLLDTTVTVIVQKIQTNCTPPNPPHVADWITLHVAEGISGASGLASHKWDDD